MTELRWFWHSGAINWLSTKVSEFNCYLWRRRWKRRNKDMGRYRHNYDDTN